MTDHAPCMDQRDRLEAEVNRWHAEAVHEQMKATRLIMQKDTYRAALRQILWLADATEPLSVKAGQIAREALGSDAPRMPACGYCGDRPSSLVPCPECDS
jgi:hypothetical protein